MRDGYKVFPMWDFGELSLAERLKVCVDDRRKRVRTRFLKEVGGSLTRTLSVIDSVR